MAVRPRNRSIFVQSTPVVSPVNVNMEPLTHKTAKHQVLPKSTLVELCFGVRSGENLSEN